MKCYRFDLHRMYFNYLQGFLTEPKAARVKNHLARCSDCRERMERIKTAGQRISDLPLLSPEQDLWPKIEKSISTGRVSAGLAWQRIAVFVAVGLISGFVGAIMYGKFLNRQSATSIPVKWEEFIQVPIKGFAKNTEPHIVTEGYVSEVRLDAEDGDRVFKLVDDLRRPGPFVICELIDPLNLNTPPVGSRVRVYGVSRYDNQINHEWHEVHPVLNIEILNK